MMIFLTPKIIRNADDQRELLGKKMDQRLKYIKSIGGRDPYGETADELQKRTAINKNSQLNDNPKNSGGEGIK